MRLTKDDRSAFVRSVMNDVPRVDYEQQAKDRVQAEIYAQMPPKIQAIYDDKNLRPYLETHGVWMFGTYARFAGILIGYNTKCDLSDLEALRDAQQNSIDAMAAKLSGVIGSCATLKTALERLPEFAKYLPEDRDSTGTENLPAIANLVSDLMAAGWPKGEK